MKWRSLYLITGYFGYQLVFMTRKKCITYFRKALYVVAFRHVNWRIISSAKRGFHSLSKIPASYVRSKDVLFTNRIWLFRSHHPVRSIWNHQPHQSCNPLSWDTYKSFTAILSSFLKPTTDICPELCDKLFFILKNSPKYKAQISEAS